MDVQTLSTGRFAFVQGDLHPGDADPRAAEVIFNHDICMQKLALCNLGVSTHFRYVVLTLGSTHHAWVWPSSGILRPCRDIQVPQEAPAEVAQLINECLRPNPALRPTAAQLYDRIQVQNGQRIQQSVASSVDQCCTARLDRYLQHTLSIQCERSPFFDRRLSPAALRRRCSSQPWGRWQARCWGRTTGSGADPLCRVRGWRGCSPMCRGSTGQGPPTCFISFSEHTVMQCGNTRRRYGD